MLTVTQMNNEFRYRLGLGLDKIRTMNWVWVWIFQKLTDTRYSILQIGFRLDKYLKSRQTNRCWHRYGNFQTWAYPKMDGFYGKTIYKGMMTGGTPMTQETSISRSLNSCRAPVWRRRPKCGHCEHRTGQLSKGWSSSAEIWGSAQKITTSWEKMMIHD